MVHAYHLLLNCFCNNVKFESVFAGTKGVVSRKIIQKSCAFITLEQNTTEMTSEIKNLVYICRAC